MGQDGRAGEDCCVECKKRLAEKMNALLADIHTKREELSKKPNILKKYLIMEHSVPARKLKKLWLKLRPP